jgi:alpha-amylase/alpha-mannosidase (GH57 family)
MEKYVCIHGHFYQPPRENPWLEEIEVQDSAYPYRDWNERITAECYSPNTASRIIADNKVVDIKNNYSKMSFNFGPTLLSWMKAYAPDVYGSILNADAESVKNYSGHGAGIAQVYNHMIMPLSDSRDKLTQIIWGKEDFKYRFGREPEGMWLAETAVDIETLEILAAQGIKFTILAPRQAKSIKHFDSDEWVDVSNGSIDPKRAYECRLPSGNSIVLFFYDGAISQELAFGNLLEDGHNLANRMTDTFRADDEPQIAHIATDGETYGHHQKHGDMALAYCMHVIESGGAANITIYGEYLEKFPPQFEVQIVENTSWSCIHGVERWRNDCGCNSGRPGWNQQWRAPLRQALDWLRDTLMPLYKTEMQKFTKDSDKIRNDYIKIILDRTPENVKTILAQNGIKEPGDADIVKIFKLLEMQRHAMLMYTSCGWFFDEISGIETVQVILYAARVIQLANELNLGDYESQFVEMLRQCPSNLPNVKNGAHAYEMYVKPAIIDLLRVAAHYAVSSLFEENKQDLKIYSYEVFDEDYEVMQAGRIKMVIGRSVMRSQITYESEKVSYAFLHLGDQNLNGGVRESISPEAYDEMKSELKDAFDKVNIAEIILLIDKHFGTHNYTLWHLFKDQSRKVFSQIMTQTIEETEYSFRNIYDVHYPLLQAMKDSGMPLPRAVQTAVDFVLNTDIKRILANTELFDAEKLEALSSEAKKWNSELERPSLSLVASNRINKLLMSLQQDILNLELLKEIELTLSTLKNVEISLDVWKAQNIVFMLHREYYEPAKEKAESGDKDACTWVELFQKIESLLNVSIS